MKMTTKIIAVLLTVISTATFANTNDSTRKDSFVRVVTGTANGSYKLIYQGDSEQVKFKLLDDNGDILHDERLRVKKGFIQPVDISKMPSGDYTFMVESRDETLTDTITYTSVADRLAENIRFDQVADQLEFIGTDLSSEVKIRIYNDRQELVYTDVITAANVDQIFDFGRIKSDWVSFTVSSNSKVIADHKFRLK